MRHRHTFVKGEEKVEAKEEEAAAEERRKAYVAPPPPKLGASLSGKHSPEGCDGAIARPKF